MDRDILTIFENCLDFKMRCSGLGSLNQRYIGGKGSISDCSCIVVGMEIALM